MRSVPPPGKPADEILCIVKSQGYQGLYVHFGLTFDHARERQTTQLTTAYLPTPEQIARIVAGEPIVISIINVERHPPIMVGVNGDG
jgi:hypothetical protein